MIPGHYRSVADRPRPPAPPQRDCVACAVVWAAVGAMGAALVIWIVGVAA